MHLQGPPLHLRAVGCIWGCRTDHVAYAAPSSSALLRLAHCSAQYLFTIHSSRTGPTMRQSETGTSGGSCWEMWRGAPQISLLPSVAEQDTTRVHVRFSFNLRTWQGEAPSCLSSQAAIFLVQTLHSEQMQKCSQHLSHEQVITCLLECAAWAILCTPSMSNGRAGLAYPLLLKSGKLP